MPAQILPLIDSSDEFLNARRLQDQESLNNQRMQNQQERIQNQLDYHGQLNDLQEARLQTEQALNPLRQQIMQSELQKNQQAFEESHFSLQQAMASAPDLARRQSALADEAQSNAQISQQNATGTQPLSTQQRIDNQLKTDELNLRTKLQTAELTNQQRQAAHSYSAMILGLETADPVFRNAPVDSLLKSGEIDQQLASQIMSAPDRSKDYEAMINESLGQQAAYAFHHNNEEAHRAPTTDETMLSSQPGAILPQTEAYLKNVGIIKQLMDRRGDFSNAPSLPVGAIKSDGSIDTKIMTDDKIGTVFMVPIKDANGKSEPKRYIGNGLVVNPKNPQYFPKFKP